MASLQQILYTYVLNPSWISGCIFVLYPFFADYYILILSQCNVKHIICMIFKYIANLYKFILSGHSVKKLRIRYTKECLYPI